MTPAQKRVASEQDINAAIFDIRNVMVRRDLLNAAEWAVVFCRLALETAETVNQEETERVE